MNTFNCTSVCETCPLNSLIDGGPAKGAEIGYAAPGDISPNGRVAILEMHYGVPTNMDKRTSTVGLAGQDGVIKFQFDMAGKVLDDDGVNKSFDACEEPTQQRHGILRLKKRLACTAIENLRLQ